jgi:hypothetical protein|tara:strand:- start:11 stop:529 length:519 start_codon:yes stop_codon:yes gene_type:complete
MPGFLFLVKCFKHIADNMLKLNTNLVRRINMKYLLTTLAVISFSVFADDHKNLPKPSECKGKPANYYVSKLTKNGTIEGVLNASSLHEAFYKNRGYEVEVVPSIQYLRNEDGVPSDEIFRLSTHVIFPNAETASKWRERDRTQKDKDEYDFYVNEYNKNSELTTSRFLCILN